MKYILSNSISGQRARQAMIKELKLSLQAVRTLLQVVIASFIIWLVLSVALILK